MTQQHSGSMTRSGRSRSWTVLPALAFVLGSIFAGGTIAIADAVRDAGGDDETIGTLPICGNSGQLDLVRRFYDTRPDFYLEGSFGEIVSTVVGFTGSGHVTYESRPGGKVRLGFHGQIELALDRQLMQLTGIQVGTTVPEAYRGALAASGFAGQLTPMQALRSGSFGLPVTALDGVGALDSNSWVLAARSPIQGRYLFRARAAAGILYVGQTY